MVEWKIDGQNIIAKPGQTIWESAWQVGIKIPALCYKSGLPHYTSCMVCMVWDEKQNKAIPSCSTFVSQGMMIRTDHPLIHEIRKTAIEFLLSEHIGECYAPCQKLCGAEMNIPQMVRQIQDFQFNLAIATIKKNIALPSILARICPAPCEKGCRRSQVKAENKESKERAVMICLLKGFIADWDLQQQEPYLPQCLPPNGKKIAIVGAGPLGLSSAYYLSQFGFECELFDEHDKMGGMIRYGLQNDPRLGQDILEREIANLLRIGNIQFHPNIRIGHHIPWKTLCQQYPAIVLATGKPLTPLEIAECNLTTIRPNHKTLQIENTLFFTGGGVLQTQPLAIRSLGDGKKIATNIARWLNILPEQSLHEFACKIAQLTQPEIEGMKQATTSYTYYSTNEQLFHPPKQSLFPIQEPFLSQAIEQSKRCLHCDCRRLTNCQLKQYAEQFQLPKQIYQSPREPIQIIHQEQIVLEPNKCIRCGICVRICQRNKESVGLHFQKRGSLMQIAIPNGNTLLQALGQSAKECVEKCPVGALTWKNNDD